jgi:phosphoenolpyruvate phosphomutase
VRDFAAATSGFSASYLDDAPVLLKAISPELEASEIAGEFIGLVRFSPRGAEHAAAVLASLDDDERRRLDMPAFLTRLAAQIPVNVHYVTGHWLDVDDLADLAEARNFP